jgi:hypothetical protein
MSEILRGPPTASRPSASSSCWQPADAPLLKRAVDSSLEELRPFLPWAFDDPRPWPRRSISCAPSAAGSTSARTSSTASSTAAKRRSSAAQASTRASATAREIEYWIASQHAGKGLATEHVRPRPRRLRGRAPRPRRDPLRSANAKSLSIPKKLGFRHEGTLRARIPRRGGDPADRMIWTILAAGTRTPCARATLRAFDALSRPILESPGNPGRPVAQRFAEKRTDLARRERPGFPDARSPSSTGPIERRSSFTTLAPTSFTIRRTWRFRPSVIAISNTVHGPRSTIFLTVAGRVGPSASSTPRRRRSNATSGSRGFAVTR